MVCVGGHILESTTRTPDIPGQLPINTYYGGNRHYPLHLGILSRFGGLDGSWQVTDGSAGLDHQPNPGAGPAFTRRRQSAGAACARPYLCINRQTANPTPPTQKSTPMTSILESWIRLPVLRNPAPEIASTRARPSLSNNESGADVAGVLLAVTSGCRFSLTSCD